MINAWLNLKYWIKHSYFIISELMNRMVNKLEVSNDDWWTQTQMMDGEFVNRPLNYEC